MPTNSRDIIAIDFEVTGTIRSIKDILVAYDVANVTTIYADHGKLCTWYGVQNKDGAASLYLQTSDAASGDANVEVTPGVYRQMPACDTKYDLDEEFIRVGTNSQVFSLDIKWG